MTGGVRSRGGARPPRSGDAGAGLLAAGVVLAGLLAACSPDAGEDHAADPFPEAWPFPSDADAVTAPRGMVVTADSAASAAGLAMLADGGNAVDAAVAAHFALAVAYPRAGNLGGGGFLVLRTSGGREAALDFREEAPAGATRNMFLGPGGEVTGESWTGPLASGVPGSVAGMAAAHRRYGSLPWPRLLEPAIRQAEAGFRVDSAMHRELAEEAGRLRRYPASAAKWLPGGEPPAPGDRFRQPDLARVLRTLAERGGEAFYTGWIADSLAAHMRRSGGLIDRGDLRAYDAVWREPVTFGYRGRRVVAMPPPSSGGVTLAEIFRIVEGFRLDTMGFGSPDALHVAVEAFRRAFADRNYYLGDPGFVAMPLERLTSRAYADSLRRTIRLDSASPSGRFTRVPARPAESSETTHFSVVDSAGNAVAVTTTLNGYYGSAVTARGTGILMNNEMDDFTARPGAPNAYGLVQGEANAIAPGKRMLSSMSPTLLVDSAGRTRLATGSPGGSRIITTVFQVISNTVDFGLGAQGAVNAPRVHHQHLPDTVFYEPGGLPPGVIAELRRRGHALVERDAYSGNVQSVLIREDGARVGAVDPRRGGEALGR